MIWSIIMTWRNISRNSYNKHTSRGSSKDVESHHFDLKSDWKIYIYIIIGDLASGGDSTLSHKAYAQVIIGKPSRTKGEQQITFREDETEYLDQNYNDALVVFVKMINVE